MHPHFAQIANMCIITRRHLGVSKYYHSLAKGGKTSNILVLSRLLNEIAFQESHYYTNTRYRTARLQSDSLKKKKNEIKYSRNLDRCTIKYRRIHMFYYNRIFPVVPFFLHTHTSYSIKINADGTDLNFLTGGKNSLPDNISAIFTH